MVLNTLIGEEKIKELLFYDLIKAAKQLKILLELKSELA